MNVGAVVLAAGKSTRMGRNKLLLPLDGKLLIDQVLDALAAADINEQVVVLGHNLEEVASVLNPRLGRVKIALNVDYERGMVSSFQTGLWVLSNVEAAFLVLGDEPILDPSLLQTMVQRLECNPDALIVSPIYRGKKGHPLLFRKPLFPEILGLQDTQTIRDVVHPHQDRTVLVEAPEWTTLDIDTPQDYTQINDLIKRGCLKP
jgi:molybdenum cofactor cytidylyltransferase